MTKKQWIIRILLAVLVVAALAAAGYELYNLGYSRGVAATTTRLTDSGVAANSDERTTGNRPSRSPQNDQSQSGRSASPPAGKPGQSQNNDGRGSFDPRSQGRSGQFAMIPNQPNLQSRQPGQGMQSYAFQPAGFNTYPTRNPALPIVAGILLAAIVLGGLWLVCKFITLLLTGQGWQLTFSRTEETKAKK